LVNFGAEAIELEVFAYMLTADFNKFLELREELLLRIASVVEAAGSGFAPTRFIHLQRSEAEGPPMSTRDATPRGDGPANDLPAVLERGWRAPTESAAQDRLR
jgi:hypothetical protein